MRFNLPNLLTWARILAIPFLLGVFYFPLGLEDQTKNLVATLLFVGAAITDWVDGWLARRWNQTSAFGAFLDPVADKLMVCAAVVALIDLDRVGPLVGIIIVGREITISALREWMAEMGARKSVAVNWLGKAKTIAQMVAIPFLLYYGTVWDGLVDTRVWGYWLMVIAATLTFLSMVYYLAQAAPELRRGA
ncbi:MAG: CDP-diacylglycerol--glycerol-3-phosphate 3-phosphatidyltransferase [Burkholderiaceae bacterium]|jgi:cardiolipin synthase (CMP-forming)|nr:CDP-diacylglycerol--glycerol-3-phosphate 3-phosphatidyltransferase [Burkholderiaceae bacterium]HCO56772.1 CDP-diacylglycerol--glycerol-3-phosphate 3-phosphatidyltransferase [Burkholderiales bacterium]MDP4678202.1 CDP-diacylglycerol--glycerol-3-phosphate 3-phosphatidyltransferase [Burkholderiaceae bacterium]MDP4740801.1 CDP-diacylglycerol--glycerol-3-phosphate 3-phosphatidyltransferase [Burkholderiaceae bacterium]MDP4829667.1 CDP-diacylglycerol--glycerol-3-phosphate 3-phosphatidyltransferase 